MRVEVRPRAIVRPAREGAATPSSRGNVCAFWRCAEREREKSVCVCVFALSSLSFLLLLLLISMQTPESLQCGRHGYA